MSRLNDDGGIAAVMRDEVPPLTSQWFGEINSTPIRFAAYVPSGIAVAAGIRAGDADFNRSERFDELTYSISWNFHDEIMRNVNWAAAQRSRSRQLWRLVSTDTRKRFFDMFPDWWSARTSCLNPDAELEVIRGLAPFIAVKIDNKNTEFEALALREMNGTLSVGERTVYLADDWRVPHLVRLHAAQPFTWGMNNWEVVDPANRLSRHPVDGNLVRQCPSGEEPAPAPYIQACFGYVNARLDDIEYEVYREIERNEQTVQFVMMMMEDKGRKARLQAQATLNVASLPASEVSAGWEGWRVKAELEGLWCQE